MKMKKESRKHTSVQIFNSSIIIQPFITLTFIFSQLWTEEYRLQGHVPSCLVPAVDWIDHLFSCELVPLSIHLFIATPVKPN